MFPDFIFETSWEVCNKVGGIYTVLSTRAKTLKEHLQDRLVFIGPDCNPESENPYFEEDATLFPQWQESIKNEGLKVRVGRWNIPGNPIAFLVDFRPFENIRNDIFAQLWSVYQVDSLHAYGDYDESALFSYATARTVESFYRHHLSGNQRVVFHANEWQTGFAVLLLQQSIPQIASIFTTHATCIGRSIAGNNKPLYEYLWAYNGDQMADELNMRSKHSIEKQTAHNVDCFTTVSEITAKECAELLDRPVDVVLPNGFEDDFVPKNSDFIAKRKAARHRLLEVAGGLMGTTFTDDTLIVSTSGRYEFRNKGIDVFVDSLNRLKHDVRLKKNVVAFIQVPGWVAEPRKDLQDRLNDALAQTTPLNEPYITHWLHNMQEDCVLNQFRHLGITNQESDKVKIIFVPCYLNGDDGVFNLSYYDMVLGNDLCVYPSYYEPWGYTPLEAVAFKVPCITTDLAGFGLWANEVKGSYAVLEDGVKVVHRTDYNFADVAEEIKETILTYSYFSKPEITKCRNNASKLSKKALWSKFIKHYEESYEKALLGMQQRMG